MRFRVTDETIHKLQCTLSLCIIPQIPTMVTSNIKVTVSSVTPESIPTSVHVFMAKLLHELKQKLPHLKKVHYFMGGCAGQYKNRFNFINICHHSFHFNLDCEWNFFATSHCKGPCDGVGGTMKRTTAKEGLQRH